MKYGISSISIIPVRNEPSHRSEMVTQVLFGEHFRILECLISWCRIELAFDSYIGWVSKKNITPLKKSEFINLEKFNAPVISSLEKVIPSSGKQTNFTIVPGSSIPFYNAKKNRFDIAGETYKFEDQVKLSVEKPDRNEIQKTAFSYLHSPYLWGGRTPFGTDCSGFIQILFKIHGMRLPRDVQQQAKQGILVNFITEAKEGDIAFFDNDEGEIEHVGLLLKDNQIIHSSGKVRIDNLDQQGIFNTDTGTYSHNLRVIKRILKDEGME